MAKMRHWKQRFDVNADFIFRKRMKLHGEWTKSGDVITPELARQLGRNRLKTWWAAGVIELAPTVPQVVQIEKPEIKEGISHLGGGWYELTLSDGSKQRVHGKANAEKMAKGDG